MEIDLIRIHHIYFFVITWVNRFYFKIFKSQKKFSRQFKIFLPVRDEDLQFGARKLKKYFNAAEIREKNKKSS